MLNKISKVLEIDILEFFKTQDLETQKFKNKEEMVREINSILNNLDLNKAKLFYKILKVIVE